MGEAMVMIGAVSLRRFLYNLIAEGDRYTVVDLRDRHPHSMDARAFCAAGRADQYPKIAAAQGQDGIWRVSVLDEHGRPGRLVFLVKRKAADDDA